MIIIVQEGTQIIVIIAFFSNLTLLTQFLSTFSMSLRKIKFTKEVLFPSQPVQNPSTDVV